MLFFFFYYIIWVHTLSIFELVQEELFRKTLLCTLELIAVLLFAQTPRYECESRLAAQVNIYCVLYCLRSHCSFKLALLTKPNAKWKMLGFSCICEGHSLCCRGEIRRRDAEGETVTNRLFRTLLQLQGKC